MAWYKSTQYYLNNIACTAYYLMIVVSDLWVRSGSYNESGLVVLSGSSAVSPSEGGIVLCDSVEVILMLVRLVDGSKLVVR